MPLFPREVQAAQYSKYKSHYWLAVLYLDWLHTLGQFNHQKRHRKKQNELDTEKLTD